MWTYTAFGSSESSIDRGVRTYVAAFPSPTRVLAATRALERREREGRRARVEVDGAASGVRHGKAISGGTAREAKRECSGFRGKTRYAVHMFPFGIPRGTTVRELVTDVIPRAHAELVP